MKSENSKQLQQQQQDKLLLIDDGVIDEAYPIANSLILSDYISEQALTWLDNLTNEESFCLHQSTPLTQQRPRDSDAGETLRLTSPSPFMISNIDERDIPLLAHPSHSHSTLHSHAANTATSRTTTSSFHRNSHETTTTTNTTPLETLHNITNMDKFSIPQQTLAVQTYTGYIQSTEDALLVFEACRLGLLKRTGRRLTAKERTGIESGAVFVFEEMSSGIKRWTDGRLWSPSRILDNFLLYREVDRKEPAPKSLKDYNYPSGSIRGALTKDDDEMPIGPLTSQKGTYYFKYGGLAKKTISIVVDAIQYHMVCYYRKEDLDSGKLSRPCFDPRLRDIVIPHLILDQQSFRKPQKTLKELRLEDRIKKYRSFPYATNKPASSSSSSSSDTNETTNRDKYYVLNERGLAVNHNFLHVLNEVSKRSSSRIQQDNNSSRRASFESSAVHDINQTAMILADLQNSVLRTHSTDPKHYSSPPSPRHYHQQQQQQLVQETMPCPPPPPVLNVAVAQTYLPPIMTSSHLPSHSMQSPIYDVQIGNFSVSPTSLPSFKSLNTGSYLEPSSLGVSEDAHRSHIMN